MQGLRELAITPGDRVSAVPRKGVRTVGARCSYHCGRPTRAAATTIEGHVMNTTHDPKRIIAGAPRSGGLVLAGLGLGAGTANADPGYIDPIGPYHWCPGGRPWMSIGTTAFATPTGRSLPGPVTWAGLAIFITTFGGTQSIAGT